MGFFQEIKIQRAIKYYYEKDGIMAPKGRGENSEWFGKAAAFFGLTGRISKAHFEQVVRGELLDTKHKDHRAGYDCVFSPPKSLSLMALHYGDNNLIEAHKEAVREALAYAEQIIMQYRYTSGGQTIKVQSDNMLAATFMHSTSRDNDPQLHTHAIIMNLTITENGVRAMSNELLYENQKLVNTVYQSILAAKVKSLGYQLKLYHNKFEIDGVSEEAIKLFSKRSKAIDEEVREISDKFGNAPEAIIRNFATLNTRADKEFIEATVLKARWEAEFACDKLYVMPVPVLETVLTDIEIFDKALEQVTKSEMCFPRNKLLELMLSQNRGSLSISQAEQIWKTIAPRKLVEMFGNYSTPALIDLENRIVFEVRKGKGSCSALLSSQSADEHINTYENLTEGQRRCLRHILTASDRISIVQGDAGTGKTFVIDKLRETLEKSGVDLPIIGLAYTGKAAQELKRAAHIKAQTIQSYLNKPSTKEQLFIVDESSMLSSADMLKLLEISRQSRIVFVGDGKQLQAIGAGRMFKDLQAENVIQYIYMQEVLRQKTELTKSIVANISGYQEGRNQDGLRDTLTLLEQNNCIIHVENGLRGLALAAMTEYDSDTVILTSTRAERDTINRVIRASIRTQGYELNIKEQLNGTIHAADYAAGDLLYCNSKYLTVRHIDERNNVLACYDSSGKRAIINPRYVDATIYRAAERNMATGEQITFLKNDYKLNVQNGLTGAIEKIDQRGIITVRTDAAEVVTFDIKKYPYIDYAYAQTICKSQGSTYEKVVLVGSYFSTEAFYTAASRCKSQFKIITTDIERLAYGIHKEQLKTSTRALVAHDEAQAGVGIEEYTSRKLRLL